ncbi:COG1470 family protein [Streptomyces griseocarneus]|uniref:COG1470 family protein n=1 Tax=Streptomyces griseocarneus TaxID=51201 RepID=UPI00167ED209|nr:hypothetical protein [Streptomyces griseocarneus]MBZ6476031.1 hypothetical protein [Streptomyces griseocarneus]GHG77225.1 hypothetical protein GCM10018779_56040 [Streptomyces griseocarneus]
MTSRTRAAAPLLAAALAVLAAPPVRAAAAADAVPWTAAPVPGAKGGGGGGHGAQEGRSSFYLEGAPGTVLEDKLSVRNPGDRRLSVELRGTGPWISLAARRVDVPPRTRADVPLTVTVPAGTPPGDHSAAVAVSGGGRWVRVPMAVRVGGPALSALSVEHVRVSGTGRGAVIRYALVNRGNTALAPRLTIRAEGLFGELLSRPATGVPARLPPGESVRLEERWPDAPRLDRVAVRVTATAPDGTRAAASASYAPLPWLGPALAGLGALAALGAARWLLRRRRSRS